MKIQSINIPIISFHGTKVQSRFLPGSNFAVNPLKNDIFVKSQKTEQPKSEDISFGSLKKALYSDEKKFAKYFSEKIKDELKVPKKEDIENIISSVSNEVGLEKEKVQEIVSRLTQFSTYKTLTDMGDSFRKINSSILCGDNFVCSLGGVLMYAGEMKKQFKRNENDPDAFDWTLYDGKRMHIADGMLIERFKSNNESDRKQRENLKSALKNSEHQIAIIDGWNVKTENGYSSYGMFDKGADLKTLTRTVAKKVKDENCSIDEALNGDIIKDVRQIFGKRVKINLIKNDNANSSDIDSILDKMTPNMPDEYDIMCMFDILMKHSEYAKNSNSKDYETAKELLAEYFDTFMTAYSSETLAEALRDKYKQIEELVKKRGGTMDDVVYGLPRSGKSFELIAYQYARINNIPTDKIVNLEQGRKEFDNLSDKFVVILDDMIGSGDSMVSQEFQYYTFTDKNNPKGIIFAPLVSYANGEKKINDKIFAAARKSEDCILPTKSVDTDKWRTSLPNHKRQIFKSLVQGGGTDGQYCCTTWPYMGPDNNCGASGLIANFFLNNPEGNLGSVFYRGRNSAYREIRTNAETLRSSEN